MVIQYVLLFCGTDEDAAASEALSPDQLQPPATATSVRHRWQGGEPVITDGPFIEAKESIGDYASIDVAALDEALRMARTWPGRGTVEIRPVRGR